MAAAATALTSPIVQKTENMDKIGGNLVCEFHTITYDSDKTVEVTTQLKQVLFMSSMIVDATDPAEDVVLGSDLVITSGAVTVGATANNTGTFRIKFEGYL